VTSVTKNRGKGNKAKIKIKNRFMIYGLRMNIRGRQNSDREFRIQIKS
jgi:hypothetical protein